MCIRDRNTTEGDVSGTVIPPEFSPNSDYFTIPDASGKMVECETMVECGKKAKCVPFHLKKGCGQWFPMVIYAPGETDAVKVIEAAGTLHWLNETLAYFRGMLGNLTKMCIRDRYWAAKTLRRSIPWSCRFPRH